MKRGKSSNGNLREISSHSQFTIHNRVLSLSKGSQFTILFIFFSSLTIYLLTLAPDITWAHYGNDGGDLITAAVTLGTPHPSGYATYTLLGKLFSFVPLGTIAYRFNLFSALCMAGSATLLAATLLQFTDDKSGFDLPVVAASLTYAFAPGIWKQAVITEVYALNLLCIALLLWTIASGKSAFWQGLVWGVCITTHLTSLLLLPLLLLSLSMPDFAGMTKVNFGRQVARLSLGVLCGLLPLLTLPLLAAGDSPVVWGDATTAAGWWWLVTGRIYRPNVLAITKFLPHLRDSYMSGLSQFSYIGWLLLADGLYKSRRNLLFITLAVLAAIYALYALSYDTYDFGVFALPALLLLSPILYQALRPLRYAALLLPLLALALNFTMVNLHDDTSVRLRAESALQQVSADALVITPGDQSIFTLWYLHYVEGQRSDIIPIDGNLLAFDWYRKRLQRLYPDVLTLDEDNLEGLKHENNALRPVCEFSIDPNINVQCKAVNDIAR